MKVMEQSPTEETAQLALQVKQIMVSDYYCTWSQLVPGRGRGRRFSPALCGGGQLAEDKSHLRGENEKKM